MGAALREFVKAIVGAGPTKNPGVVPKPLGAEYAGENEQLGWRKKVPATIAGQSEEERQKQIEENQEIRKSDLVKTKYFNEAERDAAAITFDKDGKALGMQKENDDGTVSGEVGPLYGTKNYVVDPETGEFYQGGINKVKVVGQVPAPFSGENPVKKDIKMEKGEPTDKLEVCHHSSMLAGKPVAGAGEIKFDAQGNIVRINNSSGHYKPGAPEMIGTVEILIKAGALLDHAYTDAEGNALSGEAKKLYDAAMKVQGKLVLKLKQGVKVYADEQLIARAKAALAKMGCTPGERFVKAVSFADTTEEMTGAQIKKMLKDADDNPVTAYEFLSTGGTGDEKQIKKKAELKQKMHEELRKHTKAEAQTLDEAAEKARAAMFTFDSADLRDTEKLDETARKARAKALKAMEVNLDDLQAQLKKLKDMGTGPEHEAERKALRKEVENKRKIVEVKLAELKRQQDNLSRSIRDNPEAKNQLDAVQKEIAKLKPIVEEHEEEKLDEATKLTGDLEERHNELSSVAGAKEEDVPIPPEPEDWGTYVEDTDPDAKEMISLRAWAKKYPNLSPSEVWGSYNRKLAAKKKALGANAPKEEDSDEDSDADV